MTDVRLSRRRPEPEPTPEVRHRRARPSHAAMDVTVPRAESELSGYAGGETVEIVVRVAARVTQGNMKRGDLELWLNNALQQYHNFRAGHVGLNANAKIRVPRCVRIDELAD